MTLTNSICPSLENELKFLKDFQRQSLDAVFRRLYLDKAPTRRFLLADEVGLGKTMVARGLITHVIDHLWDKVPRIDIVYLCSNSDIARQNIGRLTPRGIEGVSLASRITLLPLTAHGLKGRRVNIIALTPGTSLDLKGNLGVKRERALLAHLLIRHWDLNFAAACRVFAGNASVDKFKAQVRDFPKVESVDKDLSDRFLSMLDKATLTDEAGATSPIRARVELLVESFRGVRKPTPELTKPRNSMIGELRERLARSCIIALEPDLIILDEFQRFKHLLDGKDPAGEMAKQLFEYEGDTVKARVLLLSATPYKMYTGEDEADDEDHYSDFVRTMRFLLAEEPAEADRLAVLLRSYRKEILRVAQNGDQTFEGIRSDIERILRKVVVRTERLAVTADRNGMLVEVPAPAVSLGADDALRYVHMQRLAKILEHPDTIEYWKASPWLLNFMDKYKFSDAISEKVDSTDQSREFVKAVEAAQASTLASDAVSSFQALNSSHGRLKWLVDHMLGDGLWKLLWLPPSLGYYELGEPFAAVARKSPTKALLFSAWRIVPRAVAAALSHEVERRMYVGMDGEKRDLSDATVRFGDQLKVGRTKGRVSGLTVLPLLYPSFWLARECDPSAIGRAFHIQQGRKPTVDELVAIVEKKIAPALKRITAIPATRATPDESWYWAAPLLLDRLADLPRTTGWLERDVAEFWSAGADEHQPSAVLDSDGDVDDADDNEVSSDDSAFGELVQRARKTALGEYTPRGTPPHDLLRVLALMAIGAPGTIALRSLARVTSNAELDDAGARDSAARIAGAFRTLFNQPDSTANIRASMRAAGRVGDYWKQCLEYCVSGDLQAVVDEYAHLLHEEAGVVGKPVAEVVSGIGEIMVAAIGIRRAKIGVRYFSTKAGRVVRTTDTIRSRFAMRYGEERADESGDKVRADDVRRAFNSPFWPFVLATTSVGQEGLDFHLYCHKVIHWNLPSNPVDLEQREGRVHRFKGHAVRKNVAMTHGGAWHDSECADPWHATFERARALRSSDENDLVPYWVYPVEGGAAIERHVPVYPLSRDVGRLSSLRDSLALYRMVFGQPRQDELLAYLTKSVAPADLDALSSRLKISLAP